MNNIHCPSCDVTMSLCECGGVKHNETVDRVYKNGRITTYEMLIFTKCDKCGKENPDNNMITFKKENI